MPDSFSNQSPGLTSPASAAVAVTPSDSADLATTARALYIGVSGDVAVTLTGMATGTSVVFKAVPVGFSPIRAQRVWATGTTAVNIVAVL